MNSFRFLFLMRLTLVLLGGLLPSLALALLPVEVVGNWHLGKSNEKFHGVTQGGFSGLVYLEGADKLVAIQDRPAENKLGPSYLSVWEINRQKSQLNQIGFSQAGILELGPMPGIFKWAEYCDLEALVRMPNGQWLASSEGGYLNTHAEILRFDERLRFVDKIPLFDFYRPLSNKGVQKNQSVESLAISPTGQWLYTANEMPLFQDLEKGQQTWVRVTRFRKNAQDQFNPVDWAYYQLQAEPGNGLVELVAYGERELLALERSYDPKTDQVIIRVYQFHYPVVGGIVGQEVAEVMYKRLVVDLNDLKFHLAEPYKHLDNYEGMALGPIAGGKRELYMITDDNFSATQKTMLLGLRIPWPLPEDLARPMNPLKSKQGM